MLQCFTSFCLPFKGLITNSPVWLLIGGIRGEKITPSGWERRVSIEQIQTISCEYDINEPIDKEAFKNDENNKNVIIQNTGNTSENNNEKIERQVIDSTSEITTEVEIATIEKEEITVGWQSSTIVIIDEGEN